MPLSLSPMFSIPMCPHCRQLNAPLAFQSFTPLNGRAVSFWLCSHCQHGICIESEAFNLYAEPHVFGSYQIFPRPASSEAPEFTPSDISKKYREAKICFYTEQFTASAIMSRCTLEAVVKTLGASGNNLRSHIEDLAKRHVITPSLASWAHSLRIIGNEAAHELTDITKQDAEQALFFAEMLLTYIYTLPGRIEQLRNR